MDPETVTENILKNEPMIYSGSPEFAYRNGGSLTRAAIDACRAAGYRVPEGMFEVIDTRVTMLFDGHFPCVPGWHCDAVPRDRETGDLLCEEVDPNARHFVMHVSTSEDLSQTEFITSVVDLDKSVATNWGDIHSALQQAQCEITKSEAGVLFEMNSSTLHRCAPATGKGWRFFFRLSFYPRPPLNEIRQQAQVYVVSDSAGW